MKILPLSLALFATGASSQAAVLSFQNSNFGLNPTFNDVQDFSFTIEIAANLTPGTTYNNPPLTSVVYNVFGSLIPDGSPSGFPGFNLARTIGGAEFYSQGSSLTIAIAPTADLSDGLQVSELIGADPVFEFNGREVGTGRYHPALFQLNADGTGSIRNSNNFGGVNPSSMEVVDVTFGEEYITELTFDASTLTLSMDTTPEPSQALLLALAPLALIQRRKRR